MNKVIAAVPMVAAAALLSATPAVADVAYMTGLFGAKVDYASIKAPTGQGCDPGAGCDLIPYANFSVNAASLQRGVQAIEDYVAAHPGENTIWTYSDSTDAAIEYMNTHPEDTTTQFYLLGAPSTPGNFSPFSFFSRHPTLANGVGSNATFVLRQYDIVADVPAGTRNFARYNLSQRVHRDGYNGLDLSNPAVSYTDPRTGSTTQYFLTYPLPLINPGWKTPEQIAAQDKALRPGIESQYYVPGKVQRPVVLPSPTYPVTPTVAQVESTTPTDTDATTSTAKNDDSPRPIRKLFSRLSERQQSSQPDVAAAAKDSTTTKAKKDRPRLRDRIAARQAERAASSAD
ncbi:PE-PPE domain-containing protein [Mycobacterium kyogaense]|uniref:PE-PPE domain-containing protein n=1 Tax=Mycobacterium kyogaense TaxID=2212479 RepID=UPI000DADB6F8|nr:PE-PPE domain-containing protein [Mycobacterium kyogaense]